MIPPDTVMIELTLLFTKHDMLVDASQSSMSDSEK